VEEIENEDGTTEKQDVYSFCKERLWCPTSRALINMAIQFAIYYCYKYCFKAGLNGGVVASIFASSLVFTIIIFSLPMYGQKISKNDIGGTVLIVACIACVGLGSLVQDKDKDSSGDAKEAHEDQGLYVFICIILAVLVGALFTL
jgi:drug/metabolite transporter (DMT)-like permease